MSDQHHHPNEKPLREIVQEQAQELRRLRDEVQQLSHNSYGARPAHPDQEGLGAEPAKVSRSGMLKTIGAAAVGAIGVAALGTGQAAASDGQPLLLGHSSATHKPNTAKMATELVYSGPPTVGVAFLVNDTKFPPAEAAWPAALGAWAGNRLPHGLFAYTSSQKLGLAIPPTAVAAFSLNGYGGYFSGPLAQISLEPQKGFHPGMGKAGDLFVDSNHDLWFCKGGTEWYHVV